MASDIVRDVVMAVFSPEPIGPVRTRESASQCLLFEKNIITLLRNSPPSKNWSSQEKSGSARKGFFIENKTTHRVLTCEVSELRYFNAWQPRIPAKSTCGGYAVELVLGSTLVNVLV